jgi:hypothetical protein
MNQLTNQSIPKNKVKLRVSFLHQPIKKTRKFKLSNSKSTTLTQSVPFKFGVTITNIGETIFSGGKLESFKMINPGGIESSTHNLPVVKLLNPGESVELILESHVIYTVGPTYAEMILNPNTPTEELIFYSHDEIHQTDVEIKSKKNLWVQELYCQGELEIQQAKTNLLIFILTLITVAESIFGLKDILFTIIKILQIILTGAVSALQYLLNLF